MFFFGAHEDTAQIYWENHLARWGKDLANVHYDEMSLEQLRRAFTVLYMTYNAMLSDEVEQGVIDAILPKYDDLFKFIAAVDDSFKEAVRTGRHQFLPNFDKETVNKYRGLAGLPLKP